MPWDRRGYTSRIQNPNSWAEGGIAPPEKAVDPAGRGPVAKTMPPLLAQTPWARQPGGLTRNRPQDRREESGGSSVTTLRGIVPAHVARGAPKRSLPTPDQVTKSPTGWSSNRGRDPWANTRHPGLPAKPALPPPLPACAYSSTRVPASAVPLAPALLGRRFRRRHGGHDPELVDAAVDRRTGHGGGETVVARSSDRIGVTNRLRSGCSCRFAEFCR